MQHLCIILVIVRHKGEIMHNRGCGDQGIGQLDVVILADADGFSDNRLVDTEYERTADKLFINMQVVRVSRVPYLKFNLGDKR